MTAIKRPRGRPPVAPDASKTQRLTINLTPGQSAKLARLALAAGVRPVAWVAAKIDAARG